MEENQQVNLTPYERVVISAAQALVDRLQHDGEWYDNGYGQPTCTVCGSTNRVHDVTCELHVLMGVVDQLRKVQS